MSENMSDKYLRTLGFVLRRTNYGEADRILNIITPVGKISAIAKGVRREKSKLAGGVEMFSLIDLNIHRGKGEIGTITGARMVKFLGNILKDLSLVEVASGFLKKINIVAESSETEEYFNILNESLEALNDGVDVKLVEAWFLLNLSKAMGEEINLYRDAEGEKLAAGERYVWDYLGGCFVKNEQGDYSEDEIKVLRLMTSNNLKLVRKVRMSEEVVGRVFELARGTSKM